MDARALAAMLIVAIAQGCASSARLYDLHDGSVLSATYVNSGTGHGAITIEHPVDGSCQGEYSTATGGAWGVVYGGSTAVSGSAISLSNRGAAVATCRSGRVFDCEYIASLGRGSGFCNDNRGQRYRLMF